MCTLTNSCDDVCEPNPPQTLFFLNNLSKNIQQEDVAREVGPGGMAKAASDKLPPLWIDVVQVEFVYLRPVQLVIQHEYHKIEKQENEDSCASSA